MTMFMDYQLMARTEHVISIRFGKEKGRWEDGKSLFCIMSLRLLRLMRN